jgi:hypothetical protein
MEAGAGEGLQDCTNDDDKMPHHWANSRRESCPAFEPFNARADAAAQRSGCERALRHAGQPSISRAMPAH